jgi:uncharacterized membrane protein YhaH (DUF805 family)
MSNAPCAGIGETKPSTRPRTATCCGCVRPVVTKNGDLSLLPSHSSGCRQDPVVAPDCEWLDRKVDGVKFGAAVKAFWKNYAVFRGRAKRSEYWWAVLFIVAVSFPIALIDTLVFFDTLVQTGSGPLSIVYLLVIFLPSLTLLVRRFQDVGLNGWFVVLTLIPFAGAVFALVVSLLPSQPENN